MALEDDNDSLGIAHPFAKATAAALEAAWKYILIASCGSAFGLIAVFLLYVSGIGPLGEHHVPQWSSISRCGSRSTPTPFDSRSSLRSSVSARRWGLAPMHAWLPDAHGAGPTPTSAMLSGALLSDALYAILRFAAIANLAVGHGLTHILFFVVGLISLFLAASFCSNNATSNACWRTRASNTWESSPLV